MFWKKKPSQPVPIPFPKPTIDVAARKDRTRYTSDLHILERYERQKVFVYGSEMERFSNHDLLGQDRVRISSAQTTDDYSLWRDKKEGNHPIALVDGLLIPCPIKGELYSVSKSAILELDRYHRNGIQFNRKRVSLTIALRAVKFIDERDLWSDRLRTPLNRAVITLEVEPVEIKAWMYVGVKEYWEPQLDAGYYFSPVKMFSPKNTTKPRYYYYTIAELNNK